MWKNKTVDKIFKYFGYDPSSSFTNDEEKATKRASALAKMKAYGKIPSDVLQNVIDYDDTQIEQEKHAAERKRRERERLLNIRRTKDSNRENDSFSDDFPAKAVYQFIMDEGELSYDENDIDSFKSGINAFLSIICKGRSYEKETHREKGNMKRTTFFTHLSI